MFNVARLPYGPHEVQSMLEPLLRCNCVDLLSEACDTPSIFVVFVGAISTVRSILAVILPDWMRRWCHKWMRIESREVPACYKILSRIFEQDGLVASLQSISIQGNRAITMLS